MHFVRRRERRGSAEPHRSPRWEWTDSLQIWVAFGCARSSPGRHRGCWGCRCSCGRTWGWVWKEEVRWIRFQHRSEAHQQTSMNDFHVFVWSRWRSSCHRCRDLERWEWVDYYAASPPILTHAVVEVKRVELSGRLDEVLQAAIRCQPVRDDCPRRSDEVHEATVGGCFGRRHERSRLPEWTVELINRNVPVGSDSVHSIAVAISRRDCDFELSLACSRVNRYINWKRDMLSASAEHSDFHSNDSPCCPAFSPQIVMPLTVRKSSLHFWKAAPFASGLTLGPAIENCLKSNRIWQIWKLTALMRYVQVCGIGWLAAGDTRPVVRSPLNWPHWMLITGS